MSDIITVNISLDDEVSERADFGTPLLLAYHENFADLTRTYNTATFDTELVADGFATSDPVYLAAAAIAAQASEGAVPPTFKVGRRTEQSQRVLRLTPTVKNNAVYSGKINGVAFTYTSDATATAVEILAGVETSIGTGAEPVTTDDTSGTYIEITGNVGDEWFTLSELSDGSGGTGGWSVEDVTPVPGTDLQTDLAAIWAEDAAWYGLCLADARSKAQIVDAETWAATKTNNVRLIAVTHDAAVANGTAGNVALTLNGTSSESAILFSYKSMGEWPEAAWFGRCLPIGAGRQTWAGKTLSGITPENSSSLTTNQRTNLATAKANYYRTTRSRNATRYGWSARGRFLDIIRCRDAIKDEAEASLQDTILDANKVSYDLQGATKLAGTLSGVMTAFAEGEDPPLIASSIRVSPGDPTAAAAADKAARIYRLITGTAQFSSAIDEAVINLNISI